MQEEAWSEDKPTRTLQAVIQELSQEQDQNRIRQLAQELNDAMLAEERRKVRQRLGRNRNSYIAIER